MSSCSLRRAYHYEDSLFQRLAHFPCVRLKCGTQIGSSDDAVDGTTMIQVLGKAVKIHADISIAQLCRQIMLSMETRDLYTLKSHILIDGIPLASASPETDRLTFLNLANNKHIRFSLFTPSPIEIDGRPSSDVIKEMLRLEVRHRTSKYILMEMGKKVDSGQEDWMPLVEPLVQLPIVRAFGFDTPSKERVALMYLRSAAVIWPEDPDFRTIPYWVHANRARDTSFQVGDVAPKVYVHLLDRDGSYSTKEPLIQPERMQILLAGSIT